MEWTGTLTGIKNKALPPVFLLEGLPQLVGGAAGPALGTLHGRGQQIATNENH